jgi:phosphotriesterase-related protein
LGVVNTVKGPVDADRLGATLMHEHVFVRSPEIESNWDTGWNRAEQVSKAVDRLAELHDGGIGTLVDLTVVGLGRDIELIQEVAAQVALHIVVATGLYTYDSLPHYFDMRTAGMRASRTDELDDCFLGDIEDGIAGSGVRAGILKCATDKAGVTRDVERVLRAVARVHRQTGVPISTHTDAPKKRGLEQQEIFTQEGVDLSRVVIGHSGDTEDLDYLHELLAAGSTLGMDRFGVDAYCPTEKRIEIVAQLCEEGFSHQLVLSHDASCHIDWFDNDMLRRAVPNWHFLHISQDILPALRSSGVSGEHIDAMMVDAPRRILDHGPGY